MRPALDFIAHLGGWLVAFLFVQKMTTGVRRFLSLRRARATAERRCRSATVVRDLAQAAGARTSSEEVRS